MIDLLPIALAVGLVGIMAAGRFWRELLFGSLILTVYEGALRKWVFPSLQGPIYFVKDGMILLALAGYLMARKEDGSHEPAMKGFKTWLTLLVPFCLAEALNPNLPSVLIGLLGLKSYLLYTSLVFIVPHAFHSIEDFRKKLTVFMVLMIPVTVLGFFQFMMPPDHWINTYVQHDVDRAMIVSLFGSENRVRTSGTFSYIGGYSTFIQAMFALALGAAIALPPRVRSTTTPYVLLAGTAVGMFTTGSRSTVFGCLGIGVIVALLSLMNGLVSGQLVLRGAVAGGAIGILAIFTGRDAIDSFEHRVEHADDPIMRLLSPLSELIAAYNVTPFLGMGLGANGNGSLAIMGQNPSSNALWWLQGNIFELETARVMQEIGPIGFILEYGLRIAMVVIAMKMVKILATPWFKGLSAGISAFFILHLGLFVVNNPTAGIFYWFASGLLYAMYRLDRRQAIAPKLRPNDQSVKSSAEMPESARRGASAAPPNARHNQPFRSSIGR